MPVLLIRLVSIGVFKESLLTIASPFDRKPGDLIHYDEVLALVDEKDGVWNCRNGKGLLDGYLAPQKRGTSGEIFVSFRKNGKQNEPIVYGEPGITIQVEESNRFGSAFFSNKLTNFKYNKSKVVGGYISCNGSGQELHFVIHRNNGMLWLHGIPSELVV